MSNSEPTLILSCGNRDAKSISSKILERINFELKNDQLFNEGEIDHIETIDLRLINKNSNISVKETDRLRTLAKLSNLQLKPAAHITSHRKYLGKLIVWLKRGSWPFINIHLKQQFTEIQEFAAETVKLLAAQSNDISSLQHEIKQLNKRIDTHS